MTDGQKESMSSQGQVQILRGEDLNIPLGAKVLIEPRQMTGRFWCQFVGMIPHGYIILRLPQKDVLLREALAQEQDVTVRYLTGSKVCGFASTTSAVIVRPATLVFLRYPKTIQVLNLRRHERANCLLPIIAYHDGNESHGLIINMSESGCKVMLEDGSHKTTPGIKKMQELFCQFRFLDMSEDIYVKSEVKNIKEAEKGVSLGIEFKELSAEVHQKIARYVEKIRQYDAESD